uniref:Uncharacterized protein n=1 Tax=Rhizophora mucronata TaxID=61149 RepID=A0A2P2Q3R4_RHIMU
MACNSLKQFPEHCVGSVVTETASQVVTMM